MGSEMCIRDSLFIAVILFLNIDLFSRKGKRFRAEVDVRFHHEDVLKKSKVQLSSSEGDVSTSGGGDLPSDCPSAYVGADPPDLDSADEGAAEFTTRHYQRLQKAEYSWSKLREAMLMTTFQAQGSFSGKNCFFCNSVTNRPFYSCVPSYLAFE